MADIRVPYFFFFFFFRVGVGVGVGVNTRCWGPDYVADKIQSPHPHSPMRGGGPISMEVNGQISHIP